MPLTRLKSIAILIFTTALITSCVGDSFEPTLEPIPQGQDHEPRSTPIQIITPGPTSTPSISPTPIYIPQPPPHESPLSASTMTDVLTTSLADEHRANGDSFTREIYERPYTAADMTYVDYLDIGRVISLGISGEWIFISIPLAGEPPQDSPAYYAVELDLNVDGRGDWLFLSPSPSSAEWSQEGVSIYIDSNVDVGGIQPSFPDQSENPTDGYDALVFHQGEGLNPDAVWVCIDPASPTVVQFAFQHGLIAHDRRFLWKVIASGREIDPRSFELNDIFSLEEAGSPLLSSPHYPIGAISLIDSSCRWSYGFTPLGTEPGVCGGSN